MESYAVDVMPEGPLYATFSALTDDGVRVWGRSGDRVVMDALLSDEEACGRPVTVREGAAELH